MRRFNLTKNNSKSECLPLQNGQCLQYLKNIFTAKFVAEKVSSRHSLIAMFERWKKSLGEGWKCSALLIDLSKVL